MFFLKFNNINIIFIEIKLIQKFYSTNTSLFTTKQVYIINKTKFAIVVLNTNNKIFVIHIAIQK